MSNSLDPDKALYFVRPDLGQNCLQSYQQKKQVYKELNGYIVSHLGKFYVVLYIFQHIYEPNL